MTAKGPTVALVGLLVARAAVACDGAELEQAFAADRFETVARCVRSLEPLAAAGVLAPEARETYVLAALAIGAGSNATTLTMARDSAGFEAVAEDLPGWLSRRRSFARVLLEHQRAKDALAVFEEIVTARRDHALPGLTEALIDAASALARLGRAAEAVVLLEEAAAANPTPLEAARLAETGAMAWRLVGDAASARPYLERALELRKELMPARPETALTKVELGELLTLEGRFMESEAAFLEAAELLEVCCGSAFPHLARAWGRVAGLARTNGDLARSVALHERALRIALDWLGPDSPETISRLNDFANARLAEGDFPGARDLYQQALAQSAGMAEPERSMFEATIHYNLAEVATEEQALDLALGEITQAVDQWRSALGPDHPFVALALESMATVRERRGEWAAAAELLEFVLAIRRQSLGDAHPRAAVAATRLGQVERRRGNLEAAARALDVALAVRVRTSALRAQELAALDTLDAWVTLARGGAPTEVVHKALAADNAGRAALRQAVRYLSENDALRVAQSRSRGLDLALSLVAEGRSSSAERRAVYDAVIRSRALVLGTLGARAKGAGGSVAQAALRQRLDEASRRLANLIYRGPGVSLEKFTRVVAEAQAQRDSAERELALASADYRREVAVEEAGFADVVAALPPRTALLALVRYQHTESANPPAVAEEHYLAFVSRRGETEPFAVGLGRAVTLDAAIERWRAAVRDVGGALVDGPATERTYRQVSADLTRLLWQPLARQLVEERVFVVADGLTQVVNFAALPVENDRYLVDGAADFHWLTTERELLRTPAAAVATAGLLALGAPSYSALPAEVAAGSGSGAAFTGEVDPGRLSAMRGRSLRAGRNACGEAVALTFENLPGTGREATEIAALWRQQSQGEALVLLGSEAGTARFAALAHGRRVLHVATHGFYLDDACDEPRADGAVAKRQNPMLLAGLAFAGANHRQSESGEDDGILTAEEISRLDLGAVEWAVLSACDTGRGRIHDGEGVLGLRHAFEIAGARSVLTSLWQVDDVHARRWMRALYQARLVDKLDTVGSAASASRALVKELRREGSAHPALWAAFVATGDWR